MRIKVSVLTLLEWEHQVWGGLTTTPATTTQPPAPSISVEPIRGAHPPLHRPAPSIKLSEKHKDWLDKLLGQLIHVSFHLCAPPSSDGQLECGSLHQLPDDWGLLKRVWLTFCSSCSLFLLSGISVFVQSQHSIFPSDYAFVHVLAFTYFPETVCVICYSIKSIIVISDASYWIFNYDELFLADCRCRQRYRHIFWPVADSYWEVSLNLFFATTNDHWYDGTFLSCVARTNFSAWEDYTPKVSPTLHLGIGP